MWRIVLVAFLSAPWALVSAYVGQTAAAPAKVSDTCQSCHGPGGNSPSASVLRLNGQQAAYIVARLHDFLDPTKEDPHATKTMWGW
jgi:cytochrome c553